MAVIYLNYASQALLPEVSLRAATQVLQRYAQEGSLPMDYWKELVARARETLARLLGVPPETVAFISNTTHGIHLAMSLVPFEERDRVIVVGAFPALVAPWMYWGVRGVEPTFVRWVAPSQVMRDVRRELERRGARAVFVDWVHYATGRALSLGELLRLVRSHDAYLVVDGIQGLGLLPFGGEADIMVAGGTKWLLGPEGTGVIYVNPERTWEMGPVGWMSAEWESFSRVMPPRAPEAGARRLEAGSRNLPGIAALGESAGLLLSHGERWAKVKGLVERIIEGAHRLGIPTSLREPESGIVGLGVPEPEELARRLAQRGIRVSAREGWLRVSPHCVNTREEVEEFLAVLGELV